MELCYTTLTVHRVKRAPLHSLIHPRILAHGVQLVNVMRFVATLRKASLRLTKALHQYSPGLWIDAACATACTQ